jgi:flagellar motor switch/type III secretory pathway protein FliN
MTSDLIHPEIVKKGEAIAKALMEGGSAGWSTLLSKNVDYAIVAGDFGRPDEVVKPADISDAVITSVDWSGDTSGKVHLLMPAAGAREVVAHFLSLMLGGDPDPATVTFDAEGMDAYSEAANSYFGQGSQQARSEIGGNIKTTVTGSKAVDFSKTSPGEIFGKDEYYCAKVKVTIEGRPPFAPELLISQSVTGIAAAAEPEAEAEREGAEAAGKLGIDPANLAIAMKIRLPVIVSVASKRMRMEDIQNICPGTIIEFKDNTFGENLDVMVGTVKVATAEAVTTNQRFGVQIRSLVDPHVAIRN